MKIVIEFYRTRQQDGAHAVVGRVTCEAIDSDAAVAMARSLLHKLDMPQVPDVVRVCDDRGEELFRGAVN